MVALCVVVVPRRRHVARVRRALRTNRVVAILGARQVGKTTLAHEVADGAQSATWFDLVTAAGFHFFAESSVEWKEDVYEFEALTLVARRFPELVAPALVRAAGHD